MNIMSLRVTGYIVLGVVMVLSSLFLHFLIHMIRNKLPTITIVIIKSRTATVEETTTATFTGGT